MIELRRGEHVIIAQVVWRDGARAGLQSDERVPAEEIMSLTQSASIRAITSDGVLIERRQNPRPTSIDAGRHRQRFEFVIALAVVLLFALEIGQVARRDLAYPLVRIAGMLPGHF